MGNKELFVARFLEHPLGAGRYAKDFRYNLTLHNKVWWDVADDTKRMAHFQWALNHPQYHYSTDDIQKADVWYCDQSDADARAILDRYAQVEFIPVTLSVG